MSTTTDGRSTRWDEHRASRRRELVEATLRAIREHGAGVGMDDIAAAAGTSKTVFYRHFTDRSGLYAAVSESVDARILRDLGTAMGDGTSGTLGVSDASGAAPSGPGRPVLAQAGGAPRAVIAAAIDSYLALVERDPEVYRFVVNAPLLDTPSAGDPALAVTSHIADQMSALIGAALTAAGRDPSAADVWGVGVVGMVRAAADQWLADPAMTRPELTTHLTDLAWGGLSAAWPDPT